MKKIMITLALLASVAGVAQAETAVPLATAIPATETGNRNAYLQDSNSEIIQTVFGLCVHTGFWTEADAIPLCEVSQWSADQQGVHPEPGA